MQRCNDATCNAATCNAATCNAATCNDATLQHGMRNVQRSPCNPRPPCTVHARVGAREHASTHTHGADHGASRTACSPAPSARPCRRPSPSGSTRARAGDARRRRPTAPLRSTCAVVAHRTAAISGGDRQQRSAARCGQAGSGAG
jgi:hypothetical protein